MEECQNSFDDLKKALCEFPVPQYPDFEKPFILTTDSSDFAVGAVLSQGEVGKEIPTAYMSHIMKSAESNHKTMEKECLAIIYAVLHSRPYLYDPQFILVRDHGPLKWIDSVKSPVQRLIRWRTRLREYQYTFLHKPGRLNVNADALSQNPVLANASVLPVIPSGNPPKPARQATSSSLAGQLKSRIAQSASSSFEVTGTTMGERVRLRHQREPERFIDKSQKLDQGAVSQLAPRIIRRVERREIPRFKPNLIQPSEIRKRVTFDTRLWSESSFETETAPIPRKRNSGFLSL